MTLDLTLVGISYVHTNRLITENLPNIPFDSIQNIRHGSRLHSH